MQPIASSLLRHSIRRGLPPGQLPVRAKVDAAPVLGIVNRASLPFQVATRNRNRWVGLLRR
jgi:hypothetical protein